MNQGDFRKMLLTPSVPKRSAAEEERAGKSTKGHRSTLPAQSVFSTSSSSSSTTRNHENTAKSESERSIKLGSGLGYRDRAKERREGIVSAPLSTVAVQMPTLPSVARIPANYLKAVQGIRSSSSGPSARPSAAAAGVEVEEPPSFRSSFARRIHEYAVSKKTKQSQSSTSKEKFSSGCLYYVWDLEQSFLPREMNRNPPSLSNATTTETEGEAGKVVIDQIIKMLRQRKHVSLEKGKKAHPSPGLTNEGDGVADEDDIFAPSSSQTQNHLEDKEDDIFGDAGRDYDALASLSRDTAIQPSSYFDVSKEDSTDTEYVAPAVNSSGPVSNLFAKLGVKGLDLHASLKRPKAEDALDMADSTSKSYGDDFEFMGATGMESGSEDGNEQGGESLPEKSRKRVHKRGRRSGGGSKSATTDKKEASSEI